MILNCHNAFQVHVTISLPSSTKAIQNTVPSQKRAHYGILATPHFGLNFLLRSNVYLNMRPCVAALEKHTCSSNGWFMRTELQIVYVRSISNLPKLSLASFMQRFSSLVPRPLPCFQCYTQKRGRAWYAISHERLSP